MTISDILGTVTGKPSLTDLAVRRSKAEAELAEAKKAYQKTALAVEQAEPGADLENATKAVQRAEKRLQAVKAAQVEAQEVEAQRERQDRAQALEQRNARRKARYDGRIAPTKRLMVAIAEAVDAYREFQLLNSVIASEFPEDIDRGALLAPSELWFATRSEIARNWPDPTFGQMFRFPGGLHDTGEGQGGHYYLPDLKPLVQQVREANAHVLKKPLRQ